MLLCSPDYHCKHLGLVTSWTYFNSSLCSHFICMISLFTPPLQKLCELFQDRDIFNFAHCKAHRHCLVCIKYLIIVKKNGITRFNTVHSDNSSLTIKHFKTQSTTCHPQILLKYSGKGGQFPYVITYFLPFLGFLNVTALRWHTEQAMYKNDS